MRLSNHVSIITGGANGIGFEAARTFAEEGASVVIADYNEEVGAERVASLREEGLEVTFIVVDVSSHESAAQMVAKAVSIYGKVDSLINNAGITDDAMLKKMTTEQFRRVIDVNLIGVFNCTQAVLPTMTEAGKGKIVNTASVSGAYGNIGQTNYAAAKAGVIGMTKTWAKELGRKGINVNAVAPGFTETAMVESVPKELVQQLKSQIPLQRLGKPKDVAYAYLFLCSRESDYVHGHVLHVDGGIVM
ncbi:short-chain dehydrogenase [Pontibacillus halophilus JSM 076056 = DSM 19796]|uniref:Short-chain dehydrogenase n=1 Tax=Pontibacillus halophilus JSM 076056 = DSM 19796 TaxID=1385510 RepID=A0A0A5GHI4_9BACI|nr:3-oxoacyl-ACP reductase FabG [Pontibacillus halophilus]KGX90550.1 short-chain dehydrogenase [Pontibacillus halophilus JSM 076056 = DSM 19796]